MIPHQPRSFDSAPDFSFDSEREPEPNSSLGRWLSWLVIACVTFSLIALSIKGQTPSKSKSPPQIAAFDLSQLELQAKTLIFQRGLFARQEVEANEDQQKPQFGNPIAIPDQLDEGTVNQRWCFSILLNELDSPAKALEHLALTNERLTAAQLQLDEKQERVNQLLSKSFQECEAGEFQQANFEPGETELMREQLGWFADLLFASDKTRPELMSSIQEQAASVFKLSLGLMAVGGLAIGLGGFLIVLTAILIYLGKLNRGFTEKTSRSHFYLQTFAIWMSIFIGGQIVFELALGANTAPAHRLAWGMIPFLGSLVALAWPCICGVSFSEVLADIGWKIKNPVWEVFSGIASYFMLLPFMILGLLIFAGTSALTNSRSPDDFSSSNNPSHPIQEWVADSDPLTIPLIIMMACVAAPIVEETMFRGVFYRYLRDATCLRAPWLSITLACLVNSLIFAAIHPQGLMALPLLGTLAVGFSLSREHRDSLIAPMVMHGMNNGIITLMLIFLL